jgi:CRP/FNR family transcriptional regulator
MYNQTIMYTAEELIERMRAVPHFMNSSEEYVRDIVLSGHIVNAKKGETIFSEGLESAGLYVLFQGKVNLVKTGIQGQETIITVIKPVIMFNEVSVLDGGPNPVSAIAMQDCSMWRISHAAYQGLMARYPQLGTGLLRILAKRNRAMLDHIEDLSSRPVLARTAKVLLDLSHHGQDSISRSLHSNNEIAALVSSVPGAISRSLKNIRQMGLIECSRNRITITHVDEIIKLAQIEPMELSTSPSNTMINQ